MYGIKYMSIIRCKHCARSIDTDFNAEHEDECGTQKLKDIYEECGLVDCDDGSGLFIGTRKQWECFNKKTESKPDLLELIKLEE